MPKLCVECEHHHLNGETAPPEQEYQFICYHPNVVKTDLVSGKKSHTNCRTMRKNLKSCGPLGLLWEREKNNEKGETSQHIPYHLGCVGDPRA